MKCYNHPESDAIGACVSCKKAMCGECAVEVQGRLICRDCLAAGKTSTEASDITDNDKMMALLAYIIPLVVPLVILLSDSSKQNRFQRYHAVHALAMGVTLFVIDIAAVCLVSIITLGYGAVCALPIAFLPLVLEIYYGVQAYQGRYVDIPLVTDLVKGQGWI